MNGLTLRISNSGGKKLKNSSSFSPVDILRFIPETSASGNPLFSQFSSATNTDEQLTILKKIFDEVKEVPKDDTVLFLVAIFWVAEAKHPVKCFLIRHVTRNIHIQEAFSRSLSIKIKEMVLAKDAYFSIQSFVDMMPRVAACMENFPAGAGALKEAETELICYLDCCLKTCINTLKTTKSLSPTEKNELFNLVHLALRLLLHLYSHHTSNGPNANETSSIQDLDSIQFSIQELLFNEDVPMDTKSVCGILCLTLFRLSNGIDAWVNILKSDPKNETIQKLISNGAAQLSIYSAIATVISVNELERQDCNGSALCSLTRKILEIGERNSSDSVFVLGVTRTLNQISKTIDKVADRKLGLELIEILLTYVWSHLEHHMDSVRHLTAQMLSNIVKYCSKLDKEGTPQALSNLFAVLKSLDRSRKSYFVTLTALISEVGASRVMGQLPVIPEVLEALSVQAVQASATTSLETLLQKHIKECDQATINREWIEPIVHHVTHRSLDNGVLNILENILTKAVKLNESVIEFILPHIKQSDSDLKCVLMLTSVVRRSGVKASSDEGWKGIISYQVLEDAAVVVSEETRILALSLIVESPKTTEVFSEGELKFVLKFLRYNINAQSPHFRQLTLSMVKKFIKRLEDSFKVLKKQKEVTEETYNKFLEDLRYQCFDSLIPGANYSRRVVALQVLAWCEGIDFCGYDKIWKEDYVEKLLLHLEDSYENNKALALAILNACPIELLSAKTYSISLDINDIVKQASSMKPTDCISAAYKLDLLRRKLPERILGGGTCTAKEPVIYTLMCKLHKVLCAEQEICERSIVRAAVNAPMYGVIHCMVHFMGAVDVQAISSDHNWKSLINDVIQTCIRVNSAVECVVNNSSPEGHLPMDMGGVEDHGNSGGIRLENGRQVTAQMVLLCAWRSVKEVSLLLGEISSRLSISSEDSQGTLSPDDLVHIGEHFTKLLAETKHRGAFEQAYVGFTKLLARLWRCRTAKLHELPRTWLSELMEAIASGDKRGTLCATRRSAGLPFMIQALVTTELQVQGNPKCFHECMTTLLHLARTPPDTIRQTETTIETRTHSINILRALFRNSALDESVSGYVGEGLMVALEGFEGGTWMERNSSTLLFSALMVRVFGVQRSKDTENLCVRNRMTGRIFFLRYPQLYDFMLNKLKEVSSSDDDTVLRPSLYPVLLLLARLYPSSLEGTVSNLKLVAFIPLVLSCAQSGVLKTRQLAAKAMVALISPEQYIRHLESMFELICDKKIKKNYCHGILLQLIRLLDAKPDSVILDDETRDLFSSKMTSGMWMLEQALGGLPCWLLLDEYIKMVNLVLWRFPTVMTEEIIHTLKKNLHKILFETENGTQINSGKEISLANALYLYLIILNKYEMISTFEVIYKSLDHHCYEVIISMLNYILILYDEFEFETKLEEHLKEVLNRNILGGLRDDTKSVELLCKIFIEVKYQECIQKALKVLSLKSNTEKVIVKLKVGSKELSDGIVIKTLINCVENEHANLTHIYLDTLSNFASIKLLNKCLKAKDMLEVLRVIFACISSENSDSTRSVVLKFLENYYDYIVQLDLDGLSDEERFEYKATFYATLVTALEDDNDTIRERSSYVIAKLAAVSSDFKVVISSKSAEILREIIVKENDNVALFIVLALLDFKCEVCLNDDVSDECRVFDQNERYNIFLEETIWTRECADKIIQMYGKDHTNILDFIQNTIQKPQYKSAIEKLCNTNLIIFEKIVNNDGIENISLLNPKIKLFVDRLHNL